MLDLLRNGFVIEALIFILVAVISIVIHELAHGYAAIKNGDLTPRIARRMTFNPVSHFDIFGFGLFLFVGFGWAKPVPVNPSNFNNYRRGLFQVSIAGVLLNFIIAFISYPLMQLASNAFGASQNMIFYYVFYFFNFAFLLNLALCVFNLLPIYPLDGFRILESRLRRINPYIDFMYKYGMFVLIGFLFFINFSQINLLGLMRNFAGYPIRLFWSIFGL